ncbi:hypothetical protein M1394_03025 [Candidatus Marsarchaeota archaeon]|nr:hypothetical protein [Candidatus Marsarchaeota archaeon]
MIVLVLAITYKMIYAKILANRDMSYVRNSTEFAATLLHARFKTPKVL